MANVGLGLRATSSYWAIILVYSAFNLVFAVWILSRYFRSIPKEIEEAALIDGLGRLKVLLRVVLPLAKPGVVTALIFTFIQVWNEFVVALTLFNDSSRNRQTLTWASSSSWGCTRPATSTCSSPPSSASCPSWCSSRRSSATSWAASPPAP
jgi:ABC-type glycerol-3-phosphate transport system permease component